MTRPHSLADPAQRAFYARHTFTGPVVRSHGLRDHRDAVPAVFNQMLRQVFGGVRVVEADAWQCRVRREIEGADGRKTRIIQQSQNFQIVTVAGQHDGIDTALDERSNLFIFAIRLPARMTQQHPERGPVETGLKAFDEFRKDPETQARDDHADDPVAAARKRPRGRMGDVAELAYGLVDTGAGLGADHIRLGQGARDRGRRNTEQTRHVVQRRRPCLTASYPVPQSIPRRFRINESACILIPPVVNCPDF